MMHEASSRDALVHHGKTISVRKIVLSAVICIVGFIVGILIGRFATCPDNEIEERDGVFLAGVSPFLNKDEDPSIGDSMIQAMNSDNIRNNLRFLSEFPHLAGTEQNRKLAYDIKESWEKAGLDHVTIAPYDVLLSYPNSSDLNYVELLDQNGEQRYKSALREPILTPEEDKDNVVPPFNAYSAPGDITGELVYVNYGRVEDYKSLADTTAINVTGKIVIARYGKIFRGDKARLAEVHGAIGIILFSDPADYTMGDTTRVYPDDWWLPPSGTQRGTTYVGDGDPLTPDYPSISTAYREPENATEFYMPRIPVHPIGYGIAERIFSELGGSEVPLSWRGGMNVTYRFGSEFKTPGWKIHMSVSTSSKRVTTHNVIGVIRGEVEPDRYVLIGNHRDAWVFGALDPSSGTAIMMEMARVMGEFVKTKQWRPRRSIFFCSWGAEEYGLVGSTEWVEQYTKALGARAIAYLNVDIAVQGNATLRAQATPLLFRSVFESSRKVPNPNETEVAAGRPSVYDTWVDMSPSESYPGRPEVAIPGSGSDYAPFRDRLGLPIIDLRYTFDHKMYSLSSYPLYHSMYETFHAVDNLMDTDFQYHTAVGRVWLEMGRHLADSLILPFNVSDYALVLEDMCKTLLRDYGDNMTRHGLNTSLLYDAIGNFSEEVHYFEHSVKDINMNDPLAIRKVNDQLMQLDRNFLDPAGLPSRRLKRHILFAESSVDNYAGSSFPGLVDTMFEIEKADDPQQRWESAKKHFSVILFFIQSASSTLRDVTNFMYTY